ncbi:MAG: peptide chain release factor N(5)-glutamine methyltransferase [Anaerolineae bacterium]
MPEHASSVQQALLWATSVLAAAGVPSPRLDAEVLLAHVLGWRRAGLYARPEFELTPAQQQAFQGLVERRYCREPVPYITGHREFYGLDFIVDRRVLIPRPETELLVERALETAEHMGGGKEQLILADIGTGSGVIAISLAMHLPHAIIYATDAFAEALEVAACNVSRYHLSQRVHLLQGDLLQPLPGRVHLIVANLPYVSTDYLANAAPDVLAYEPLVALDGGPDGLAQIRRLLTQAGQWLLPGGAILLEIGAGQGREVTVFATQCYPAAKVELFQDYAGLDRIVRMQM